MKLQINIKNIFLKPNFDYTFHLTTYDINKAIKYCDNDFFQLIHFLESSKVYNKKFYLEK